jgi:hypothetical protein
MPTESLSSPGFIERAATSLEQALARIVAHIRAEFASERRAMDADLRAAKAELATVLERLELAHKEFGRLFEDMQRLKIEARGEPGIPGEPGKDGAPGERGAEGPQGRDGRDGMPGLPGAQGDRGKDGIDGKDGKDGVDGKSFDHLNLADIHGGPFVSGEAYKRGQLATYGGSTFMCLRNTTAKPEGEDWRLIVKHGLPGRNGKDGERGPVGPQGRDGRDLTQMTSSGLKYG